MRRGRLLLWGLALLALAGAPGATAQAPEKPDQALVLVGGRLIDGYGGPPLENSVIVVRGNRIEAVGRVGEVAIPTGARVISTEGHTVLPGLMDMHVHLMIIGHADYDYWFRAYRDRWRDVIMPISAKQLLMAGVTSAVDLGGTLKESLSVRDRIKRGEIPGPRMWMSGPWITRDLGDYSDALPTQILVDTPAEAARAVDQLADAGVDVIKAYVDMRPEHYRAIADAAHRRKLKVHAHVYDPVDVRNALEAGVDVLTHAGSAGTPPYDPGLVKAIAVKGTPVVITAAHRVWLFPATVDFPERIQDPRLKHDFTPQLYEEVMNSLRNFHRLSYFATTDRQMLYGKASLKQWIDAGVVMGMGTDSGTPLNFHTEALWREIKAHVDMGMSPARAISAATRVGADILGRGADLGTIEPGKLADIIVVNGNPLFDIVALANVETVVKGGVIYKGGGSR